MSRDNLLTIEILPYSEAPWAPRATGAVFDWAWRIQGPGLFEPITGACRGPRKRADELARKAAARIAKIRVRKGNFLPATSYEARSRRRGTKSSRQGGPNQARRIERAWKATAAIVLAVIIACGGDPYAPPAVPTIEVITA